MRLSPVPGTLRSAPLLAQAGTVDKITIDDVTIVDVVKGQLLPNVTVVLDGKRIASVARARAGALHSGTEAAIRDEIEETHT